MQYQKFIFKDWKFDKDLGEISLNYSLDDDINFTETFLLPNTDYANYNPEILKRALDMLHLACGISYFKTHLPPKIILENQKINQAQADFWNKLYTLGLGEFFYVNNINPNNKVNFEANSGENPIAISREISSKILLPIGGGKDSFVSSVLLDQHNFEYDIFTLGTNPVLESCEKSLNKKRISIDRQLDSQLFELNKLGALNGHIPISSIIACISFVASILYGYRFVILSNERSANEGNLEFHGVKINHQYSKSLEFEKDFTAYVQNFITKDFNYFSLLRPLSELHIAKIFSEKCEKYFDTFTSCNRNFKICEKSKSKFWCGECPKCAFVFTILSPFIDKKTITHFFGKNLFADKNLLPLFLELMGEKNHKPFECVGTRSEVLTAFNMASEKNSYSKDFVMQYYTGNIKNITESSNNIFTPSMDHNIPKKFQKIINEL